MASSIENLPSKVWMATHSINSSSGTGHSVENPWRCVPLFGPYRSPKAFGRFQRPAPISCGSIARRHARRRMPAIEFHRLCANRSEAKRTSRRFSLGSARRIPTQFGVRSLARRRFRTFGSFQFPTLLDKYVRSNSILKTLQHFQNVSSHATRLRLISRGYCCTKKGRKIFERGFAAVFAGIYE